MFVFMSTSISHSLIFLYIHYVYIYNRSSPRVEVNRSRAGNKLSPLRSGSASEEREVMREIATSRSAMNAKTRRGESEDAHRKHTKSGTLKRPLTTSRAEQ